MSGRFSTGFLGIVAAAVCALQSSVVQASTLDLLLRLDKTGYDYLTIWDENYEVKEEVFDFLDLQDNVYGIRPIRYFGFRIGEYYSLVATEGDYPGDQLVACQLGEIDCAGAFGTIGSQSFSIGDGQDQTAFGDFSLSGGTKVGSKVELATFEGAYYFDYLEDGRIAEWSSDLHVFTVVNVPLPAGLTLLLAGIGAFGALAQGKRIKARGASPKRVKRTARA